MPIPAGWYEFDDEGKLIIPPPKNGPQDDGYFYIDSVIQIGWKIYEFDGNYYYVASQNKLVKGKSMYLNSNVWDDMPIPAGWYEFDDEGKLVIPPPKNGPQTDGTFYINDKATHIEWAEVTPNASPSDIRSLYDRGHRAIRFTAGGVAEETLLACDELGIYVALTAPINSSKMGTSRKRGGNPSNDPRWRDEYTERVTQMIYTSQRHPSVIAYFLAEESANGICLYEAYLAAKAIAGDRPVFYDDGNGEWNSDR